MEAGSRALRLADLIEQAVERPVGSFRLLFEIPQDLIHISFSFDLGWRKNRT